MAVFTPAPLNSETGKLFILGATTRDKHPGSIFTLSVPDSFQRLHSDCKDHYTYKVRFKRASGKYSDSWMVSLLNGPDNWSNYKYIGVLNPETGEFRTTKGSFAGNNAWSVRFIRRVFAALWENTSSLDKLESAGFSLMHAGRCGICGKRLTTPDSVERGIGPVCWSKLT